MYHIWDDQRQQWVAEGVPKSQWRFRPIIPVVFYTGKAEWRSMISMETLMDVPEPLRRFVPSFETLFLGIQGEPDANLLQSEGPFGWLMTVLKRADTPDRSVFVSVLETLGDHLSGLTESERAAWVQALHYLHLLVFYKRSVGERADLDRIVAEHQRTLNLSQEEVTLMQTMAEHYLQQGIEQGIEQGMEQGQVLAKRDALLKLLQRRFEDVPESLVSHITALHHISQLDALFEKALEAETLEDIDW